MKRQRRGHSLPWYLERYSKLSDEDITLVSRPTLKDSWAVRHIYLEDWNPHTHYNHRSILQDEVVCEYDDDDIEINKELARRFTNILTDVGIAWVKWFSGNKSTHVHFFINHKEAKRVNILKSVILRTWGTFVINNKRYTPDLRLACDKHLIRAEYGIHEKTNSPKKPISSFGAYPSRGELPEMIWEAYSKEMSRLSQAHLTRDVNKLIEHPGFKFILTAEEFRDADDGRERALFMLIHMLKHKYKREELISFLQEWYRYSGGRQLTDQQIMFKVKYHWNRTYNFTENYLNNLLYELGKEDLIQSFKKD